MTRPLLPDAIRAARLVIVARRLTRARLEDLAALASIHPTVFEITLDSPRALEDIGWLSGRGATVGAGTVLSLEGAQAAVTAGAAFLVSPYLDERLVEWAAASSIPMAPGALTPTEIMRAWTAGAAAVKVFPASVGGVALLREMRGPLGHIPLMPTGGINAGNLAGFLDTGAVAVGVGGWLTGGGDDLVERWSALAAVAGRDV